MDFTNKVVLITGAGSGMGKAIALNFSKLSATLSLIDISKENLNTVAAECESLSKRKVFKVITDLGDTRNAKEAVLATIQEFGRLDVVINCVGISNVDGITSPHLLDNLVRVLNVNLKSHIAVTHYAADELIKSKGCVVNIASVLGTIAMKNVLPYAVSKAGVLHFTKCAALELAEKGVRINSISPGPVRTNFMMNELKSQNKNEEFYKGYEEESPLKHLARAEEIADMTAFLASDRARSITGADVVIDSGMTLQRL